VYLPEDHRARHHAGLTGLMIVGQAGWQDSTVIQWINDSRGTLLDKQKCPEQA